MMTLYRKYRPKKFSEISGQAHVVRTLTNAIKNNRVGHAYLLTGPRGTGKTTIARLFAKTINCTDPQISKDEKSSIAIEPCNKCENCKLILNDKAIDLVEIDAASHTGVDNIRHLKETIPLPPTALKQKVYIIDEVHMLSIGAFNALLKTLEEPPEHAVFILATTELHKVPETIISRCQRFDITNLTQDQIIQRLEQLAKNENVKIEKEALETIAIEAEGGMRDAESLFGQIIALEDESVTAKEVHEILGTSSKRIVLEFAKDLIENDNSACIKKISTMQNEGVNLKNFNKLLLSFFRDLLVTKSDPVGNDALTSSFSKDQLKIAQDLTKKLTISEIVTLLELFQKSLERFKDTTIPQLPLEMAAIEWHLSKNPQMTKEREIEPQLKQKESTPTPAQQQENVPQKVSKPKEERPEARLSQKEEVSEQAKPKKATAKEETKPNRPIRNVSLEEVIEKWSNILEDVKPHNHSIHAFLKNCIPCGTKDGTIYIKTKYDFYKDKLSEVNNLLTVQKVIGTIFDTTVKLIFLTEKECADMNFSEKSSGKKKGNILHDAMQVLGGRIVK
ncbi:MAG: DNA polymerase III subunit gamma/tau [Patescibacteria group bacterium]|nr:DNA polymerase III subunit gamma/tau [Patescibacteria group bacterium]